MPVSMMTWGLAGALSAMLIEAARPKMAVGVNVTLIMQLSACQHRTAAGIGHGEVAGVGPCPPVILVIVNVAFPVLLNASRSAWHSVVPCVCGRKDNVEEFRVTIGLVPVPVKLTDC